MREHIVNPETLRCIMCGRNPWWRDKEPECDYPKNEPPIPKKRCLHERLDMDGCCFTCGEDRRGIG